MEFSSPCAAMHPPPVPGPGGCRRDFGSYLAAPSARTFAPNSFNFRDLSMKAKPDYFTIRPVRGSSPTASLAADLSQNFHIDQSPQLPTPRRSLFTSNLFPLDTRGKKTMEAAVEDYFNLPKRTIEGTITPPIRWEGVTTPPIPSSSPGFGNDSMDISPLPHKAPFSFVSPITVHSPTPESTALDDDMLSPCTSTPNALSDISNLPKPSLGVDRKRLFPRPNLTRTKGFSTNTVSFKSRLAENQLPPFKFGAGTSGLCNSSTPLDDFMMESPPQDNKTFVAPAPVVPRPRSRQSSFGTNRITGSPITNILTKKPAPRPRKQFRRSQSMFENPGDIMKQEPAGYNPNGLQSIMDVDVVHKPDLPHFIPENEPEGLPRITQDTLVDVLDGKYGHVYDHVKVIDCRFAYEYKGGHIDGAVNYDNREMLVEDLFNCDQALPSKTLLVFHCEYSAHRAPMMARFIRHKDRSVNQLEYPKLSFPEVYILDGGYRRFFEENSVRCFPQNYVEMDAKEYEHECERGMGKLRQRTKLSRAQTFAFGQGSEMEDSPTAVGRSAPSSLLPMDLLLNDNLGTRRHAQRTSSY
ncbi:Rhodanese-like protein [Patellaria atrata CBS 101060]|uniref:M-phase inducer phosphatase n=1 Tax=Patellaria atrata CBS 101060 TaxID=1346257 RepID=A0A9P4VN05_9PEZI|nr:Rhodanese-like protein [Patellaria atrata CBS 101060]